MPVCTSLVDGDGRVGGASDSGAAAKHKTTTVQDESDDEEEEEEEVHCDVDYLVSKRGSVAKGTRQ